MYSIEFDTNIIKGDELIDIDLLNPHEKIIKRKQTKLTKFIKSFDEYYIISSILCCHKSHVIIDGHHRYFALKELGFKNVPVTKVDYSSNLISTGGNGNDIPKDQIIKMGISNDLFEPKSTQHSIYCSRSKSWHPIILLSSMFKIDTKN